MATYIPKERLGDRTREKSSQEFRERLKDLPAFKQIERHYANEATARRAGLKEKYEGNAEVQRHRTLTSEGKARDAIDRMTPQAKQLIEMRTGKRATDEDGRKYVEGLAYKKERDEK